MNWIYFLAMIEDFLLRFSWIAKHYLATEVFTGKVLIHLKLQMINDIPIKLGHAVLTTIFGFLELLRRFIWNFFRLENEHLNNCGGFRAVRDISIAPLALKDITKIEAMMDGAIADINRHKKRIKLE